MEGACFSKITNMSTKYSSLVPHRAMQHINVNKSGTMNRVVHLYIVFLPFDSSYENDLCRCKITYFIVRFRNKSSLQITVIGLL